MGYSYFDTPDGKDCDKKLLYLVKKAGILGLFVSSGYVVLVETPPTYSQILGRFARITLPFIATAAAGSAAVCMLVGMRNKDDQLNHLYGGFIGGLAGGLAKGHLGHGICAGILFGGVALVCKDANMKNYSLNKMDFKPDIEDHWSKDYDWTISRRIPKEWIAK